MIKEYKGNVELVGTVFKDAETKMAGKMEVASATIAEHSYKTDDGKYRSAFETITGKFATLKLVAGLRKDDIVKVYGVRVTRSYMKGDEEKTISEIEAQWVDVYEKRSREPGMEGGNVMHAPMQDMTEVQEDMPF